MRDVPAYFDGTSAHKRAFGGWLRGLRGPPCRARDHSSVADTVQIVKGEQPGLLTLGRSSGT